MYPDTTRLVLVGVEAVEGVLAATMHAVHTTNEPAHTLQNGIIIPQENTGTRMTDNGQARGKRSSSLRIATYQRLDELGIWLESVLGAGTSVAVGGATGAFARTYKGGVARGKSLSIQFFNGLYWRQMLGCRVNTMNAQGFGDQLATADMEIIGNASTKIVAPTIPPISTDYGVVDVPMQSVKFDGTINADVDRMSIQISNNLTQRSTMDGTVSTGRTRFGFFTVALDGMVDYPDYAGSLYEAFETGAAVGAMDLEMIDDLHEVGTGTPVPASVKYTVPLPLLADTTEGSDGGELVQMVKGRGMYDPVTAAGLVVVLTNDKAASYYAGT